MSTFQKSVDIKDHDGSAIGLKLAGTLITATAAELNSLDVTSSVEELTVTGTVTAGVKSVELNHATVIVAATIADATAIRVCL